MQRSDYAGFWPRLAAWSLDKVFFLAVMAVVFGLAMLLYHLATGHTLPIAPANGEWLAWLKSLANFLIPSTLIVTFWLKKRATPGKMLIGLAIVDESTLATVTLRQALRRFCASMVSLSCFGLGYAWIFLDPKRRSWHDRFAGTVVILTAPRRFRCRGIKSPVRASQP
ncbi:RDD family protein [Paludibacterium paludis]|uniref:RDD family protein n=1 Tax=Paludibacterium paludis TaxID=1225769 RepID=A0A918U9K5_9NEIS|nr:RDD family protein [Paludibacterium paludis]GGY16340.1 RDD family protein [Paludibacterium paludis]